MDYRKRKNHELDLKKLHFKKYKHLYLAIFFVLGGLLGYIAGGLLMYFEAKKYVTECSKKALTCNAFIDQWYRNPDTLCLDNSVELWLENSVASSTEPVKP